MTRNEGPEGPRTITQECIGCGVCAPHCSSEAIEGTVDDVHRIDETKCTGCGDCEPSCPINAITPADEATPSLADELRAALGKG